MCLGDAQKAAFVDPTALSVQASTLACDAEYSSLKLLPVL